MDETFTPEQQSALAELNNRKESLSPEQQGALQELSNRAGIGQNSGSYGFGEQTQSESTTSVSQTLGQKVGSGIVSAGRAYTAIPNRLNDMLTDPQTYKAMAIPGGLGLLGGLTTALFPEMVLPELAIGGSQMMGEYLNQKLGVTPQSDTAIVVNGIAPFASRVPGIMRMVGNFISPTKGARIINEVAPKEINKFLSKMTPEVASETLFKQADASGILTKFPETIKTIDKMTADLSRKTGAGRIPDEYQPALDYLRKIRTDLDPLPQQTKDEMIKQGTNPPVNSLNSNQVQTQLRELTGKIDSETSVDAITGKSKLSPAGGALQQVKKAMDAELDAIPDGSPLAAARQAFKRESVINSMVDYVQKASKALRGQGDSLQFNGAELIRNIQRNVYYASEAKPAFTQLERHEMNTILSKVNSIPPLPTPFGQNAGSFQVLKQATGTAIGASLGEDVGGTAGKITGAIIGHTIKPVVDSIKIFANTLSLPEGRKMITEMLRTNAGKLTSANMATMAAYLRLGHITFEPKPNSNQDLEGNPND